MNGLSEFLSRGDAAWYRGIAISGYAAEPFSAASQKNWAFFPLHPLALRIVSSSGLSPNLAGILLSHVWFLIGLVCLAELGRRRGLSAEKVSLSLWLLSCFPFSYFLSGSLTEAPFFALSVATLLAFEGGAFGSGCVTYALLCVTRLTGVIVGPGFLLSAVQCWRRSPPANLTERIFRLFVTLTPAVMFGAFMLHLRDLTGDPLAFFHIQGAWRSTPSFANLVGEIRAVMLDWNFVTLNLIAGVFSVLGGTTLLMKRRWADAALCLIPTLAGLSSGTVLSLGRFTAVQFPLFLLLGAAVHSRTLERTLLAFFAALLAIMTAGAALHLTSFLT